MAVLLVIGFHLWPKLVPGGYVGVDVFFVLSGFLITGHLVSEVERTGRIRLREFWARRVRRLLPAASIVLVACLGLMAWLVPESLWQRSVEEIAASALYVQNWLLFGGAVDYLGAENTPTLVQHYWSLSVEEQFYLVWPLLAAGAILIKPGRRTLAVVFGAVFVGSLIVSATGDASGYFSTAARAWEFAAGALVALVPLHEVGRKGLLLGWLGFGLIVWSALSFSTATPFPGTAALAPVLGTVLVIYAGVAGGQFSAGRLASARPLVIIGDHSYSLYLWHWPLIVVAPYVVGGTPNFADTVVILGISAALALLTRRFIERPAQSARLLTAPRRAFALAAVAVVAVVGVSSVTWSTLGAQTASADRQSVINFETLDCYGAAAMVDDGCDEPFAVPDSMASAFAPTDKGSLGQPCDSTTEVIERCDFGELDNPQHTVAVIGNSHAGHLIAGLEEWGEANGWKITLMRKTGCTGLSTAQATIDSDAECAVWSQTVLDTVMGDPAIDAVVVATNNDSAKYLVDSETGVDAVRENIAENLSALVANGKAVLAVGDVPGTPQAAPECVDLHHLQYDPCATPREEGEESGNIVAEAARLVPGVGELSLLPYLCDAQLCHVMIGGVVAYIDEHHLSASFSRSLGPYLGPAVQSQLDRRSLTSLD